MFGRSCFCALTEGGSNLFSAGGELLTDDVERLKEFSNRTYMSSVG